MTYNTVKLGGCIVIALACVVALILDGDAVTWASPVLAVVVGYVVGNAKVTARTDLTAPIVDRG